MLSRSMQCKAEAWLVLTIHDRDKHILLSAATWLWWTLARQSTHSLSEKPFVLFIQYPPDEGRPLATSSLARSLRGLTYSTLKFIPRSTCGKSINTQRILIMTLSGPTYPVDPITNVSPEPLGSNLAVATAAAPAPSKKAAKDQAYAVKREENGDKMWRHH